MSLVVNLFAGPGAGKSTMGAAIFSELKFRGVETELIQEFAKDLVWEDRLGALSGQVYVLGKQYHRLQRVSGQVEVIVMDTSLLNSIFYKPEDLPSSFEDFVLDLYRSFNNLNIFIDRKKLYVASGRLETYKEALEKDREIRSFLNTLKIPYHTFDGLKQEVPCIADLVEYKISQKKE